MNNDNLLQLEGAIESVVFRNDENGYTVIELADGDDYLTAVGIMPQVSSGDVVKLTGKYTNHPSYGRQFAVQICEISRPTEAADILRYLSSGAIKGIGTQTAQRLVKEFGEATLDVLENQPERVAMLKGISSQKPRIFKAVKAEHRRANTHAFSRRVRNFKHRIGQNFQRLRSELCRFNQEKSVHSLSG